MTQKNLARDYKMTTGLLIVFILVIILIFGAGIKSLLLIIAGYYLIPIVEAHWGEKIGSTSQ